uniref:Elongation of very long chain fatty acids protein n=1 Tax=Parascaris univalens TaxID=6257 RepID=A0A915BI67_PARUN
MMMDLLISSKFDFKSAQIWAASMEWTVVHLAAIYVITIFTIQYIMRERKAFDLQTPLYVWNAMLAIFSIGGFLRLTPIFIKQIIDRGFISTFTEIGPCFTDNVAGYWTFLWVFSKIPELLDTIFIVLRKRPLMFMHWYHHAATGYFSFVAYATSNAFMIWIVWLNFFIHSFMYSYFMLRSMRFRVPPQVAQIITAAQIVQFLITQAIMVYLAILCLTTNANYDVTLKAFLLGAFMEVTYTMLWFQFYYVSYIANGGKKYKDHQKAEKKNKIQ